MPVPREGIQPLSVIPSKSETTPLSPVGVPDPASFVVDPAASLFAASGSPASVVSVGVVESLVELPVSLGPLPTEAPPSSFVAPSFALATALSGEPCGGDPVSPLVAESGESFDPQALAKAPILLNAMNAMTPPARVRDLAAPSLGIMRTILMFLFSRAPMTARPLTQQ
jgi:hypothetical protein